MKLEDERRRRLEMNFTNKEEGEVTI